MITYTNGHFTIKDVYGNVLNNFYRTSQFPTGEINIEVNSSYRNSTINITIHPQNISFKSRWFEELLLLANGLKDLNIEILSITLDYMPYSRADRPIEKDGFVQLNNNLTIFNLLSGFCKEIHTTDLHSEKNVKNDFNLKNWQPNYVEILKDKNIILPDKGARDRFIYQVIKDNNLPYILFEKQRTDNRIIIKIAEDCSNSKINDYVVVDDICDGGGTFIELAKEIRKIEKFKDIKLELFVTHGIFSNGFDELNNYFTKIMSLYRFKDFL